MPAVRKLLAGAALSSALVLGFASQAMAQDHEDPTEAVIHEAEKNGATHADAECISTLKDGGTVDDCHKAPNQLAPEKNEIIWGFVGFLVVFFFVWKLGMPAIKKSMNASATTSTPLRRSAPRRTACSPTTGRSWPTPRTSRRGSSRRPASRPMP
jgi:hypothetical protein